MPPCVLFVLFLCVRRLVCVVHRLLLIPCPCVCLFFMSACPWCPESLLDAANSPAASLTGQTMDSGHSMPTDTGASSNTNGLATWSPFHNSSNNNIVTTTTTNNNNNNNDTEFSNKNNGIDTIFTSRFKFQPSLSNTDSAINYNGDSNISIREASPPPSPQTAAAPPPQTAAPPLPLTPQFGTSSDNSGLSTSQGTPFYFF